MVSIMTNSQYPYSLLISPSSIVAMFESLSSIHGFLDFNKKLLCLTCVVPDFVFSCVDHLPISIDDIEIYIRFKIKEE